MRRSTTTILAAIISVAILRDEPAWAVCAPGAASSDGLLVLDLSGCDVSPAGTQCGSERRGFGVACADDAAGWRERERPQAQGLMLASWSPPVAAAGAMVGPLAADPASDAQGRAGSSLGMAASLIAGIGLAGAQMRRRRGMQVVSS